MRTKFGSLILAAATILVTTSAFAYHKPVLNCEPLSAPAGYSNMQAMVDSDRSNSLLIFGLMADKNPQDAALAYWCPNSRCKPTLTRSGRTLTLNYGSGYAGLQAKASFDASLLTPGQTVAVTFSAILIDENKQPVDFQQTVRCTSTDRAQDLRSFSN